MDVVQVGQSYAVGWGMLSLINAGLAQSKGRRQSGVHAGAVIRDTLTPEQSASA